MTRNNIKLTLDVTKFNKNKIVERKYTNREGVEVVAKEYKIEVVALKEPKVIKTGVNQEGKAWEFCKTHFVVEEQTKEEREAKASSVFVGDGFSFITSENNTDVEAPSEEEINPDDIPF